MTAQDLAATARAMVSPGKDSLAADESFPTIKRRCDAITAESGADSRRLCREMLLIPPGIADLISGVILFDETLRQGTRSGVPYAKYLESHRAAIDVGDGTPTATARGLYANAPALARFARLNGAASSGSYRPEMEAA
jgi:fructose-bisphosphate aldolase class 1